MSLDVYLKLAGGKKSSGQSGIFIREDGAIRQITRAEWDERFPDTEPIVPSGAEDTEDDDGVCVYSSNITHNLAAMAHEADIYMPLWRPEEIGITHAHQLIVPLREGLARLKSNPAHYSTFDAPNGWGVYSNLVAFVEDYLAACEQFPTAEVDTWR